MKKDIGSKSQYKDYVPSTLELDKSNLDFLKAKLEEYINCFNIADIAIFMMHNHNINNFVCNFLKPINFKWPFNPLIYWPVKFLRAY